MCRLPIISSKKTRLDFLNRLKQNDFFYKKKNNSLFKKMFSPRNKSDFVRTIVIDSN